MSIFTRFWFALKNNMNNPDVVTITIQIGNSDDKLTQKDWHDYVNDIDNALYNTFNHIKVHFSGGSEASKPWQNYCWVLCTATHHFKAYKQKLYNALGRIIREFNQDSIAITVGDTEFIPPIICKYPDIYNPKANND